MMSFTMISSTQYFCPECSEKLSIFNLKRHFSKKHNGISIPDCLLAQFRECHRVLKAKARASDTTAVSALSDNNATTHSDVHDVPSTATSLPSCLSSSLPASPAPRKAVLTSRQKRTIVSLPEISRISPLAESIKQYCTARFSCSTTLNKVLLQSRRLAYFIVKTSGENIPSLELSSLPDFIAAMLATSISTVTEELKRPVWGKASTQIHTMHSFRRLIEFVKDQLLTSQKEEHLLQADLRKIEHLLQNQSNISRAFSTFVRDAEQLRKEDSTNPQELATIENIITHEQQLAVAQSAYIFHSTLSSARQESAAVGKSVVFNRKLRSIALQAIILLCFFYPMQATRPKIFAEMQLSKLSSFLQDKVLLGFAKTPIYTRKRPSLWLTPIFR